MSFEILYILSKLIHAVAVVIQKRILERTFTLALKAGRCNIGNNLIYHCSM